MCFRSIYTSSWKLRIKWWGYDPHYFPANSWYHNRISLDICIKRMVVIIMWTDIFLTSCSIALLVRPAYSVGCCMMWRYAPSVEKSALYYICFLRTASNSSVRIQLRYLSKWFFAISPAIFLSRCMIFSALSWCIPHSTVNSASQMPFIFRFDHQVYNIG